jgi:hypothetical protein
MIERSDALLSDLRQVAAGHKAEEAVCHGSIKAQAKVIGESARYWDVEACKDPARRGPSAGPMLLSNPPIC